jgi:XTP/dITP diphosphohydrolase
VGSTTDRIRSDGPIALASRNRGKLAELRELAGGALALVLLPDDPAPPDVAEEGDTYLANALEKARAFSRFAGMPALADDSGLEVDALGGQPGVRSARFGGPGLDDAGRCAHLLAALSGATDRGARFRCVLVLCDGDAWTSAEGVLEGEIASEPKGDQGFGYDPVFRVPVLGGRTLAEVAAAEKNRLSHRAAAMRGLLAQLGTCSR